MAHKKRASTISSVEATNTKGFLQRDKLAEFICWHAVREDAEVCGQGQPPIGTTELGESGSRKKGGAYERIYALRQLQDAMTVSQAEGLLADVALEGQNVMIRAILKVNQRVQSGRPSATSCRKRQHVQ